MEITKDECIRLAVRFKDPELLPESCKEIAQHIQEIYTQPETHDDPKTLADLRQQHPYAAIRRSSTTRGKYYKVYGLSATPEHREKCMELAKSRYLVQI